MATFVDRSLTKSVGTEWHPEVVRPLIELIAGRWVLAIFRALDAGPLRRVVLRERLGPVSDKVLTETLRRLERHGLVNRTIVESVPIEVDYGLTALARRLARLLPELHQFALQKQGSAS